MFSMIVNLPCCVILSELSLSSEKGFALYPIVSPPLHQGHLFYPVADLWSTPHCCFFLFFLTRLTLLTRISFSRSPFLFCISTRLRHDDRSLPHNDRASATSPSWHRRPSATCSWLRGRRCFSAPLSPCHPASPTREKGQPSVIIIQRFPFVMFIFVTFVAHLPPTSQVFKRVVKQMFSRVSF